MDNEKRSGCYAGNTNYTQNCSLRIVGRSTRVVRAMSSGCSWLGAAVQADRGRSHDRGRDTRLRHCVASESGGGRRISAGPLVARGVDDVGGERGDLAVEALGRKPAIGFRHAGLPDKPTARSSGQLARGAGERLLALWPAGE